MRALPVSIAGVRVEPTGFVTPRAFSVRRRSGRMLDARLWIVDRVPLALRRFFEKIFQGGVDNQTLSLYTIGTVEAVRAQSVCAWYAHVESISFVKPRAISVERGRVDVFSQC